MKTLEEGDAIPEIKLPSDLGRDVSLSEFKGKKIVLYFYPKDDTPGCTKQACEFRDLQANFDKTKTVVLGVSRDNLESHQAFRSKYNLNFPLLSDPDKKVHELFGAWGEKMMYGKATVGVLRTTVVIDEKGIVQSIKRGVKAEGNAEKTLGLVT